MLGLMIVGALVANVVCLLALLGLGYVDGAWHRHCQRHKGEERE